MNIDVLRLLVQSACAKGALTTDDRAYLRQKAHDNQINESVLEEMIKEELQNAQKPAANHNNSGFVTNNPPDNLQSGFAQNNDNDNNNGHLGSGFVTGTTNETTDKPQDGSGFMTESTAERISKEQPQTLFTDIETIDKQGAMSIVQKGKYYGRWVVIKRLKPELKDDENYKSLFYKEFENAFHLDHPNIVRLLGKGEDSEGRYYFMDFVDGRRLTKLIDKQGIEDRGLIPKIFTQLLEALSYVHKKQIVHRDLKPDNILITFRGDNVKIIDFGLATADSFEDNLKTVGTPRYAAPEQREKGYAVDQRADIYTAGLILLEMLTGDLKLEALVQLSEEEKPYIPVIERCLQRRPENRFSSCNEILQTIDSKPTTRKTIPDWLEEKIREYAADGVITKNERRMLNLEAKNNSIDAEALNIAVDLALEKAKEIIEAEKRQKAEAKRRQKAEKAAERKRQKEIERKIKQKQRELNKQQGKNNGDESPMRRRLAIITVIVVFIFLGFVFVQKYGNPLQHDSDNASGTVESTSTTMYICTSSEPLNLRRTPSENAKVLGSYPRGTKVMCLAEPEKGWTKVRIEEEVGFMASKYLSEQKPK